MMQICGQTIDKCPNEHASPTVEFHKETGTYRTEFDFHTRLPSEAVITAVAEARDLAETDLPSLYDSIDPDGLNALFVSSSVEGPRRDGTVTFAYADCEISVHGHGTVEVTPSCG